MRRLSARSILPALVACGLFSAVVCESQRAVAADTILVDFGGGAEFVFSDGASIAGTKQSRLLFRGQSADGGRARKIRITNVDFNGTSFRNFDFGGASIKNVDFAYSDLMGASFNGAIFENVRFMGGNLEGADLRNVRGVVRITDPGAYVPITSLKKASFRNSKIEIESESKATDLRGSNLSDSVISGAFGDIDLLGSDLSGADMSGVRYWDRVTCPDGTSRSFSGESPAQACNKQQGGGPNSPSIAATTTSSTMLKSISTTSSAPSGSCVYTNEYVSKPTIARHGEERLVRLNGQSLRRLCSNGKWIDSPTMTSVGSCSYAPMKGDKPILVRHLERRDFVLANGQWKWMMCFYGKWVPSSREMTSTTLGVKKVESDESSSLSSSEARRRCEFMRGFVPMSWPSGMTMTFSDGSVKRCVDGTWRDISGGGGSSGGRPSSSVVRQECIVLESGMSSNFYGQGYRWTIYNVFSDGRRSIATSGSGYEDDVPAVCY